MAFSVKWIYELAQDYELDLSRHVQVEITEPWAFADRTGVRRLELHPGGRAVVKARYAWDGCTPKFALFDIVIGTPDGIPNEVTRKPKAYYASLVHDVLYQFLDADLPLTRAQADRVFLGLLERDAFAPRWVYYAAVRAFGGLTRLATRRIRSYAGRRVALHAPADPAAPADPEPAPRTAEQP
jgi:hypothetical protein